MIGYNRLADRWGIPAKPVKRCPKCGIEIAKNLVACRVHRPPEPRRGKP